MFSVPSDNDTNYNMKLSIGGPFYATPSILRSQSTFCSLLLSVF